MIIAWPLGANQVAEYYGLGYVEAYNSATQVVVTPAYASSEGIDEINAESHGTGIVIAGTEV